MNMVKIQMTESKALKVLEAGRLQGERSGFTIGEVVEAATVLYDQRRRNRIAQEREVLRRAGI